MIQTLSLRSFWTPNFPPKPFAASTWDPCFASSDWWSQPSALWNGTQTRLTPLPHNLTPNKTILIYWDTRDICITWHLPNQEPAETTPTSSSKIVMVKSLPHAYTTINYVQHIMKCISHIQLNITRMLPSKWSGTCITKKFRFCHIFVCYGVCPQMA